MPSDSKLAKGTSVGADWWNDSCNTNELTEAVSKGAVGSTSNPVILVAALNQEKDLWQPKIDIRTGIKNTIEEYLKSN